MRRALALTLVLPALGCSSRHEHHAAVLTQSGRIGALRMDVSSRADVIAFAGPPNAERQGHYASFSPYHVLGYDCSKKRDYGWPLDNQTWCKTVFFINRRTGRLGNFYTQSSRYYGRHEVRIGMRTAKAESRLHQLVVVGCEENIYLGGHTGLTVAFTGGVPRRMRGSNRLHLVGGHVYAFALHGGRSELGVFDCL